MHSTGSRIDQPLVVILGPTAAGKTGLALQIAQALDGEIVGADSRQIYRRMDIGTAKPTPEQRRQAVHHLIDVVDPDENLSLAQYQRLAYAAIDDLHRRERLPLLVGGTGQYVTALLEGWSIPEIAPNPALRRDLEAIIAEQGLPALYARLIELDPAASFVDARNPRRVIRALEVCLETGRPFSAQRGKQAPPYHVRVYGLTLDRDQLYARADARLDQMMAEGFLDEVRELLASGYNPVLPSMSGLGYRQLADHLLGSLTFDDAVVATRNATHDFIRRQYTWFRGHDHQIVWHNVETLSPATVTDEVKSWLAGELEGKS